jgi:hypothetical protein
MMRIRQRVPDGPYFVPQKLVLYLSPNDPVWYTKFICATAKTMQLVRVQMVKMSQLRPCPPIWASNIKAPTLNLTTELVSLLFPMPHP